MLFIKEQLDYECTSIERKLRLSSVHLSNQISKFINQKLVGKNCFFTRYLSMVTLRISALFLVLANLSYLEV